MWHPGLIINQLNTPQIHLGPSPAEEQTSEEQWQPRNLSEIMFCLKCKGIVSSVITSALYLAQWDGGRLLVSVTKVHPQSWIVSILFADEGTEATAEDDKKPWVSLSVKKEEERVPAEPGSPAQGGPAGEWAAAEGEPGPEAETGWERGETYSIRGPTRTTTVVQGSTPTLRLARLRAVWRILWVATWWARRWK